MNLLPVQLLRLLAGGGIRSTAELARRLDISEPLLAMIAEDLTRRGYLAALDSSCSSGCTACGLSAACPAPSGASAARPAVLTLTEKGRLAAASA